MASVALWINANYPTKCRECGTEIKAGDRVVWEPELRRIYCGECGEELAGEDIRG